MTRIHMQKLSVKKARDCQGLETVLTIALEDRIEVSQNLDVRDGLTNGAAGEVMKIPTPSDGTDSMLPDGTIWILFDETRIGVDARARGKRLYKHDIDRCWTPIQPITKHLQVSANTQITANRTQFPIHISAAKTIHRCQGQTLDAVVADFKASQTAHMHYVGISSLKSGQTVYYQH